MKLKFSIILQKYFRGLGGVGVSPVGSGIRSLGGIGLGGIGNLGGIGGLSGIGSLGGMGGLSGITGGGGLGGIGSIGGIGGCIDYYPSCALYTTYCFFSSIAEACMASCGLCGIYR